MTTTPPSASASMEHSLAEPALQTPDAAGPAITISPTDEENDSMLSIPATAVYEDLYSNPGLATLRARMRYPEYSCVDRYSFGYRRINAARILGPRKPSDLSWTTELFKEPTDEEILRFPHLRGTFGRQTNKPNGNGNLNQQKGPGSQASSPTIPYGPALPPAMPVLNTNASFAPAADTASPQVENQNPNHSQGETQEKEKPKFFFREKYSKLGVKGNFMPLAAQPKNVDIAEWMGHQGMEQYRLAASLLQCVQEIDTHTGRALCNPTDCPVMSAGRSHTYTWLNNEKVPIKVPACQYISLVQRWIVGKMDDPKAFPTDNITGSSTIYASGSLNTSNSNTPIATGPTTSTASLSTLAGRNWLGKSAGFPETFYSDIKTCFRQIFRLYAHLYHSHWVDPFWHMSSGSNSNGWTDLNSCFVHFITVAKLFGLLSEKDMEPMQPLIDIWVANGSIPADAAKGACAISPNQ